MPAVRVRDIDFFFTDQGTGEPVLFIHGLTWDHTLWDHQVAALRGRYRCIAVDLIGHGRTPDAEHDYTFFDLADYMAGLLDALNIESAHIVGLSMGGMTAMPMALVHPGKVRSLALLDTDAQPEGAEKAAAYQQLATAALTHGWAAIAEPVSQILFAQPFLSDPANRQAVIAKLSANHPPNTVRALRAVTGREDISGRIGAIRVPTVVIVGEMDIATTPDRAEAMASAIPGATLVTIPGAGHHSPLEEPAAVTAALEAHLARASSAVPSA